MTTEIYLFFLILSVSIAIFLGYRWGVNSVNDIITEEDQEEAFQEAKAEYLKFFHKRFTHEAETVEQQFIKELKQEVDRLTKENKALQKRLENNDESISGN